MNDIVWVSLISASGAVLAAALTQRLATRAANKQTAHKERLEQVQWERSEARRKEEVQREEARRREERMAAHLREFWGHVLAVRFRMARALDHGVSLKSALGFDDASPAAAAGQAYAVALLGLTDVRPLARGLYIHTTAFQLAVLADDKA